MKKDQLLYFITPQYGRVHGGLGVSAERIVRLFREEFDLRVLVPDRDLPSSTYSREDGPGFALIRFHAPGELAESGQFLADLLSHLMENERPQHILGFYAGPLSYAAALSAGMNALPFSCFLRGNDLDLDLFGPNALFIMETIHRSRRVFCLTREQVRKVHTVHPSAEVCLIPNGVDPVLFPRLPRKELGAHLALGLFGDIKEKKGLELLLEAFSIDKHRLRIVGNVRPEMARKLHAHLLLHPEKTPGISQTPFVKNIPELLAEYEKVDLICLPSLHEGMSNVMLEAMCCGKLVLASAVGGALDVIRHAENGFLFRSRDSEDLQRVLHEISGLSEAERESIGARARETIVASFSAVSEKSRYSQAVKECLGSASLTSRE